MTGPKHTATRANELEQDVGIQALVAYNRHNIASNQPKAAQYYTGSTWADYHRERMLYDGWNITMHYSLAPSGVWGYGATGWQNRSYTWGLDVSGSFQGAGGVGGLLSCRGWLVRNHPGYHHLRYYYTYDGNGNVAEILNANNTGSLLIVAHHEYDAFGNLTAISEYNGGGWSFTRTNPFRFSTKWQDIIHTGEEGGGGAAISLLMAPGKLSYYGYRYFDAADGRWVNRDPMGERGGLNLYGMVQNEAIGGLDILGLAPCPEKFCCLYINPTDRTFYAKDKDEGERKTFFDTTPGGGTATPAGSMKEITDSIGKLDKCDCIDKLTLNGHGSPLSGTGGISFEGRDMELSDKDLASARDFAEKIKCKMCKPCQITIMSCGGAGAENSIAVLAATTGCTVRATYQYCNRHLALGARSGSFWELDNGQNCNNQQCMLPATDQKGWLDFGPEGGLPYPSPTTGLTPHRVP